MFLAGKGIEMTSFNLMNKLCGFAFSRNQVEPAPRDHQAGGKSQNPIRDGITMVMIIEKPRVHVAFA